MSCVPILNSGFCRTLLFKHKPNTFGRVSQTTICYFWQGSVNKTNRNNKKVAVTVIQAKVPMSNNNRKSVLKNINFQGGKPYQTNNAENQPYNHSNDFHIKYL